MNTSLTAQRVTAQCTACVINIVGAKFTASSGVVLLHATYITVLISGTLPEKCGP